MNTIKNVSDNRNVMVPGAGHNYHLFSDCYGIQLGQTYHANVDGYVYAEDYMTVGEAVGNGKYACRVCYKRAELPIPAEADRVAIRAKARMQRLAERYARNAAKQLRAADANADMAVAEDALINGLLNMLKMETLAAA